ncbi:ice-binding family protein [Herbiconiux daphne]|uniref:Ice-binding family protein n=1 Tax=Herbiconiux daphne TaxID=2970914 RepID=A0ABT2H0P3_9MICO|nr:ice-binding family protein [Herbiconiux daphne]MCS5733501.1 ice-binding family protein [Herbiconiux daphne]
MHSTTRTPVTRPRRRVVRSGLAVLTATAILTSVVLASTSASAHWSAGGVASGGATTGVLAPPTAVSAPATAVASVPVAWTASVGDPAPDGYFVTRNDAADPTVNAPACATSPTVLTTGTSCTDTVAPGRYAYRVTAVYRSWTRQGSPSGTVLVTASSLLGAAQSYSVLAGTAVVNTLATTLSGDLGVSPGTAVIGFPPGTVGGDIHAGDAHAQSAQLALATALTALSQRPADAEIVGDLGGRTLLPGTYHSTAALALTGTLVLDAAGDPDAIFVFQSDAAFDTAAASTLVLARGAQPANIYWVVTGAAGTGANSFLSGNILARGAITLGASTQLIGRALSRDAVTLASNTVRFTLALPPSVIITGGPVAVTQDTTPTISGTTNAAAGSLVSVTIGGQVLLTAVSAVGTWSVTAAALPAGTYSVTAKVRDADGNGGAATQSLTIEVNPPPVLLGAANSYSVLAATAVVNTGGTVLSGDLGISPGTSVTGFPPGVLAGSIHAGDGTASTAQHDLLAALADGSSRAPHTEIVGDLGGRTLHTGVHHSIAALAITGTLTLDAQGDPDAVFIMQTDAAFNTAAASTVILAGGARAANVFWIVTGAAGTGANSFLVGSILARGAITLGASTTLVGQALSLGTVTLSTDSVTGAVPAPVSPAARALGGPEPAAAAQGATQGATPEGGPAGSSDPAAGAQGDPAPSEPAAPEPVEPDPAAPEPVDPGLVAPDPGAPELGAPEPTGVSSATSPPIPEALP